MEANFGAKSEAAPANKGAKTRNLFRYVVNLAGFAVGVEVFCLYIVMAPVFWVGIFNAVLFQPDRKDYDMKSVNAQFASIFHVKREDIIFNGPRDTKLSASYFPLPGATKVVLISHGNAGNIAHRIPAVVNLLGAGFSVFIYDYEGYGKSTGTPNVKNVCEDGLAAFDYLVNEKKIEPPNIILFGESLGSGVTCSVLNKRKAGGVIIQSGFDSLYSVAREKLVWLYLYPEFLLNPMRMNNIEVLSKPHPPLLVVHGKKDSIVPFHHAEQLMTDASEPKQLLVLPNADHNDIYSTDREISAKAFLEFRKSLRNPSSKTRL